MQSSDKRKTASDTDATVRTVWLLIAVALNTLELFIPRLPMLPWLKPGLANSITIIWIIRFGMKDALLFTLLRVWISSFYFGFSLITMSLALSGGIGATVVMGILWHLFGPREMIGTLGLAIAGAATHNAGQLVAVYFLLTRNSAIWYQLPFMAVAALVFGGLIGSMVPILWRILLVKQPVPSRPPVHDRVLSRQYSGNHTIILNLLMIAGAIALVFVKSMPLLGGIAVIVSLLAFFVLDRRLSVLFHPIRLWALFLFVAFIYLFFSYGTRISYLPLVTFEGVADTTAQWLRLWTWLETGLLLQRFRCNQLLFSVLRKLFPDHANTLLAGLLALEFFPDVVSYVKTRQAREGINWRNPLTGIAEFTGRMRTHIGELLAE